MMNSLDTPPGIEMGKYRGIEMASEDYSEMTISTSLGAVTQITKNSFQIVNPKTFLRLNKCTSCKKSSFL